MKTIGPTKRNPDIASTVLKRVWGFDSLRDNQAPVVDALMSGRDVMAVMSTSGGKSICFQLPGLLIKGLVVVVSPLVALMQDQVESLKKVGVSAEFLNSSQTASAKQDIHRRILAGDVKFVYLSPEGLANYRLRALLAKRGVGLCVMDEAHCVTMWGGDFRPNYQLIKDRIAEIEGIQRRRVQRAAFTATADPEARMEIAGALDLKNPLNFFLGVRRDNLTFSRCAVRGKTYRSELLQILSRRSGKTVVFCQSKKQIDELEAVGLEFGLSIAGYHAGRDKAQRASVLQRFLNGEIDTVLATDAFGMGVDCKDIRTVIHLGIPNSLEHYVQQAGRAGRDGKPSLCVILYRAYDEMIQEKKVLESTIDPGFVLRVAEAISGLAHPPQNRLSVIRDSGPAILRVKDIQLLVTSLGILRSQQCAVPRWSKAAGEVLQITSTDVDMESIARRNVVLTEKGEYMRNFLSEQEVCLAQMVDKYFGGQGHLGSPCGACATCAGEWVDFQREHALVIRFIKESGRKYGVRVIRQVLLGSRENLTIRKRKLDGSSVFGALSDREFDEVRTIVNQLLRGRYIEYQAGNRRAGISETRKGSAAYESYLRGRSAVEAHVTALPIKQILMGQLRDLRMRLATARGCEAQRVFSDRAISEVVEARPTTESALAALPSVGPISAALYHELIIPIVSKASDTHRKPPV